MGWKFEGKVQRADFITGLFVIVFALFIFAETSKMPVIAAHTLGSAFWPRIVGGALLILGIVLTVQSVTIYRTLSYFAIEEEKKENIRDLFILSGMTVVYGGLWNVVPFLVISPIYILLSGKVLRLRTLYSVLLAVILPAILYLIFRMGLRVMIV